MLRMKIMQSGKDAAIAKCYSYFGQNEICVQVVEAIIDYYKL